MRINYPLSKRPPQEGPERTCFGKKLSLMLNFDILNSKNLKIVKGSYTMVLDQV